MKYTPLISIASPTVKRVFSSILGCRLGETRQDEVYREYSEIENSFKALAVYTPKMDEK